MKQLVFTVILLCCLHRMMAQVGNDLAGEGLRGPVKTVTEVQYYEGFRTPAMKTVDRYDTKGYLAEEVHNDYVLRLNTRKNVKYDTTATGSLSRRSEYDDSGMQVRVVDYKYDSRGRLVEWADHRNFGDKKAVYKNEYVYDTLSRRLKEIVYANDVLSYTTLYHYDDRGRLSGTKSYDKDDKVTMYYDYYYRADTEWVHCEKQAGDIRTHIFRIIDSAGLVLEKTSYAGDYSKHTTESYSGFDKFGNWLKQNVTGPATGNYFVTRVIEYYIDRKDTRNKKAPVKGL